MRDSAIFYRSFYEAIKELEPHIQAQVYTAVFEYALNFHEVELTGIAKTVFTLIKPQLDANNKRYSNGTKAKQKQNGSKTEAKNKQKRSKVEANVNVNDNVNENENGNDNLNLNVNVNANRFSKPQPIDVLNYMAELNQQAGNRWQESKVILEAQKFFDYYTSNGWKVGKNSMKDWHATVRNWMNNSHKETPKINTNEQRVTDLIAKHSDNPHFLKL
jgi:lipopolysaccharide export LptBFGC system permease protein LptF